MVLSHLCLWHILWGRTWVKLIVQKSIDIKANLIITRPIRTYYSCRDNSNSWWRHQMETFPRYWPFVRGIHWSLVNSPHKGQWHGALGCSLICARTNGWAKNRDAGDLSRHRAQYDVTLMCRINTRLRPRRRHSILLYTIVFFLEIEHMRCLFISI